MQLKQTATIFKLIIVISFGLMLSGNYFLYQSAKKYYSELLWLRYEPLALHVYESESTVRESDDRPRVVFYGDSRATQWPFPDSSAYTFMNRGINGQTSNELLLRYDFDVLPLEPEYLVVQMCINEFVAVGINSGRFVPLIDNCETQTKKLIERASETNTSVILTTVFPVAPPPLTERLFWSDAIVDIIEPNNAKLKELDAPNLILFDAHALLVGANGQIKSEYAFDAYHLNEAGYALLNQELLKILDSAQPAQ